MNNSYLPPAQVQNEIFRQLLTYETLLKEEFNFHIYRYPDGLFMVFILNADQSYKIFERFAIASKGINCTAGIDDAMAHFWAEIPDIYKKGGNND